MIFEAATISFSTNIQVCSILLQTVSRGWTVQAVSKPDICTM